MVKVFTGVYQNCNKNVGITTIVLDDNNKIIGTDHVGGDIKGEAHPDGDDLVIHASVTVAEDNMNVINEDYGPMDGQTETPLVVVIPKDMKVGDEVGCQGNVPIVGGGTPTNIRLKRLF